MALRWKDTLVLIFGRLFMKFTFSLLRLLFLIFQKIVWQLTGTQNIIDRNLNLLKNGDPPLAHRMNIVASCKGCYLQPASLRDFILTHEEYVNPMYVIEHDHISLFFFDPHTHLVVFSEGLPGQLLWKSKFDPFLLLSQFKHSQKLILMQLSEFRTVCDLLPDPQKPLIFLGNTGRCGSTLLTQVFEDTGKVITVSEGYPIATLAQKAKEEGLTPEVLGLTKDMIKYYFRPIHLMPDPAGYLLKPSGPSTALASVVKKLYPRVTTFYLYRNMDSVAKSLYKLSFCHPSMRFSYCAARLSPRILAKIRRAGCFPPDLKRRVFSNDHSYAIFVAVTATETYNEMYNKEKGVHGLLFDDIIRDKRTAVKAIFKVSGLSEELVEPALNAFHRDSQGNSMISREILAKIPSLDVTEQDQKESNKILVEFGFPTLDQETRLPGTLDFRRVLCS